ncbi:GMC family oxidoreductase [Vineibacter terrae]|uniref:GMC family oxidoreductase n=1 Tax=Vineibacter terrae TaxID=2586908 RepID=UPI002E37EFC0|nr:GMC family oxidoreductase N-terminal domain-containing protein [Vineibacter terrae]HEX2884893.1 GMC family oxidoreductase N-terminal domain-containing protein [Vineibacter terrae]
MQADYVIIGAGSAGCVLASRLSEDGARVVLLEAGPRDRNPWIHVPAGVLKLLRNPAVNWNYGTAPDAGTADRTIHWPRGRVLGGSSSINGMLYIRGNAADYDGWAQRGCRGWGWDDVLPYFMKSENYVTGDGPNRAKGGPLQIEDYRTVLPLTHRFVEAAQQAGFALSPDLNGPQQEGVGYSQMSRNGRFRGSTATTFLRAARGRANLHVETNAVATRLLFDGRRCTGVAIRQNGAERTLHAAREVILSGGTVNSPHLLQVSGIGPGPHLQSIGIPVAHDLPGVGANLSDHYCARVSQRVRSAVSINELSRGLRLAGEVARWLTVGRGALTFGVSSAMVLCRSREGLASPDIQLLFSPASYDQQRFGDLERAPGMTIACSIARPESRGTIMAASPDPLARPVIRPNYLAVPADMQVLIAGIRHARRIFAAPALAQHCIEETVPGRQAESDDSLADFARRTGTTVYHPVGTCRMGEDPMAVVDSRLRVHGIEHLRVIDASVMPSVTTTNTNAPTIMIAEKGAAMIREDARAAP